MPREYFFNKKTAHTGVLKSEYWYSLQHQKLLVFELPKNTKRQSIGVVGRSRDDILRTLPAKSQMTSPLLIVWVRYCSVPAAGVAPSVFPAAPVGGLLKTRKIGLEARFNRMSL
jgi:hypothetical protein